jgi:starch synthase
VELIKDGYNGYLVAISDFEMLAKKINSVLENQPLAAQMGQRSRDIVKGKYGWDAVVDRTEQVYIEEAGVY